MLHVSTTITIPVTQPALPALAEYTHYLTGIWERHQLTNNGPLVQQLERELCDFLDVAHLQLTTNGTIALQLAIRALNLTGEVITTPFSFVATTAAILWERCQPVFVDVETDTFCLDASKIEAAITPRTQAILATHVYGHPCDVVQIEAIARRHNLKVIYDGAHAFGTRVNGRSVLAYGDVTACSFHATKLFHTGEGGALITHDPALHQAIGLLKAAGLVDGQPQVLGTNAKLSELHAAMGLCLLPQVPEFIRLRAALGEAYREALEGLPLYCPASAPGTDYNHAYFPVIFSTEAQMVGVQAQLEAAGIGSRRYFFPSLNRLPYHTGAHCPISEKLVTQVLCLPFYVDLPVEEVWQIAAVIRTALAPQARPDSVPTFMHAN
ncbi:dTDP-4-amino-4,6-dideoxygalactose transaminase [Hymenobacter sp. UYAg731]